VIGGVAAGLGEYLDVDVVVVRLAFVALAVLGGSGLLLYLAGWLLIPEAESGHTVAHDWMRRQPRGRSVLAVVLGVIVAVVAVSNLVSSGPWWHWGWNGGFGFSLGLVALVLAVVLLVSPGRAGSSPLRALVVTILVAAAAFVIAVAATLFTAEAVSGVPLRGGIGDSRWEPTSSAQVHAHYRLAMGNLTVDLRNVVFPAGTTHVTATVGIGHVEVDVPAGPSVSVTAHSGVGQVQVFGHDDGGFSPARDVSSPGALGTLDPAAGGPGSAARIVLDAEAGVGQVQVTR
jgi:phage shock protein PspC (stress-responsive transcriptional regulator)